MRYLDLAGKLLYHAHLFSSFILTAVGCELSPDMSVFEIAQNMTKLRRIGLVKVRSFIPVLAIDADAP